MDELPAGRVPEMVRDMQQRVKETLAREGAILGESEKRFFWTRESLVFIFGGKNLMGFVLCWIPCICWMLYDRWGL